MKNNSSMALVDKVLKGNKRALGQLISQAENETKQGRPALAEIFKHTGKAHIVGITGVPGSGKSTLICTLVKSISALGRKIGIVAVDPSSPFSGGSILGDRIRMTEIADDPNIFIRSMATRGNLGGLARASLEAVDVLDAAGYDLILIETVGVGQDEVDIVRAAHTVIVISAPGLGDDIQAIKAGVLEIADIHVVSKCDRADANKTISELKMMMILGPSPSNSPNWTVPVLPTSALSNEGIQELMNAIDQHWSSLNKDGKINLRSRQILEMRILKTAENVLRNRFANQSDKKFSKYIDRVLAREVDPHTAAIDLLTTLQQDGNNESDKKNNERV